MKIHAPKNLRETFKIAHLYSPEVGASSLVDAIDWSNVTPTQIYAAVLGRLPEARSLAMPPEGYNPAEHFVTTLESLEFQEQFIRNFTSAFPEKIRLLFVHIPKCAGTDLEQDFAELYPTLPQSMIFRHLTSPPDLLRSMAALSMQTVTSDYIHVNGHITLKWYLDHKIFRFGDKIFTTVRDPVNIVLATANYIVTTLIEDPELTRPDTVAWLAALGLDSISPTLPAKECFELARRVLRHPELIQPNYLCNYLGAGTVQSTIEPLARSNIEITEIGRYVEWRRAAWGFPPGLHRNRSQAYLTRENLPPADLDYIMELTTEDRGLYDFISAAVKASAAPSIMGQDLVRHMEHA